MLPAMIGGREDTDDPSSNPRLSVNKVDAALKPTNKIDAEQTALAAAPARPQSAVRPDRPVAIQPGSGCNGLVTGHRPGNPTERPLSDLPTGCCRPKAEAACAVN